MMSLRDRSRLAPIASSPIFVALLPAMGGVLVWGVVGVVNMEMALHVEYSLGTSAAWHSWFDRGNPGEVVRHWGVPVYDQWSGLGYRLPTQGVLTDTPLAYLARFLPINSVMLLALFTSLWFMFVLVHRWVCRWIESRPIMWCATVDSVLLGMMSYYTLWHGWQTYVIQIAGAVVCLTCLSSREVVENPDRVAILPLTANLGVGTTMLMMPHLGYGMTYAPVIVLFFVLVVCSQRGVLARRIMRRPSAIVAPSLALLAMLPGVFDLLHEQKLQAMRSNYAPELGLLKYVSLSLDAKLFDSTTWFEISKTLAHTFLFPLLGLLRPESYWSVNDASGVASSWNVYGWPHNRTPFHGGVLLLILAVWSLVRPRFANRAVMERLIAVAALASMFVTLFNTEAEMYKWLSLQWVPTGLLSNSRWQYSDLSLLLMLVLLVWRANQVSRLFVRAAESGNRGIVRWGMRIALAFAVLVVACVLPYRVAEPVRLNGGQTRFAPLQLDKSTRLSNEAWRSQLLSVRNKVLGTGDESPQRVLIEGEGLMGAEGDNSWWGLRTHSQLRDMQLVSLLSWPRIRSGETLTPSDTLQHIVSDPVCDESLPARLDILATQWAVLQTSCVIQYFPSAPQQVLPQSSPWTNYTSGRERASIMNEMIVRTSTDEFSAVALSEFHHWWLPLTVTTSEKCPILRQDCIKELQLVRGSPAAEPPFMICERACLAQYRLAEQPRAEMVLVVPLNFDPTIRAEQSGVKYRPINVHGLLGLRAEGLREGLITFRISPDWIMNTRALSPLLVIILFIIAIRVRQIE